jgi:hypothetical protein
MHTLLIRSFLILIMGISVSVSSLYAKEYDLVILNGRVMDPESGLDAHHEKEH